MKNLKIFLTAIFACFMLSVSYADTEQTGSQKESKELPTFSIDEPLSFVAPDKVSVPVNVSFNGKDTTITIVQPAPVPGKGAGVGQWIDWFLNNFNDLSSVLSGLFVVIIFLLRMLPTKVDIDIFRTISSWMDKLGDVLPIIGVLFRNNRKGGGRHTAYPKQATTPAIGSHVPEYFVDGRGRIVNINQSKSAPDNR